MKLRRIDRENELPWMLVQTSDGDCPEVGFYKVDFFEAEAEAIEAGNKALKEGLDCEKGGAAYVARVSFQT